MERKNTAISQMLQC